MIFNLSILLDFIRSSAISPPALKFNISKKNYFFLGGGEQMTLRWQLLGQEIITRRLGAYPAAHQSFQIGFCPVVIAPTRAILLQADQHGLGQHLLR